jgi:hypothetical protein
VIAARVVWGCQPSLPLIAATSAPALADSSRTKCAFLLSRGLSLLLPALRRLPSTFVFVDISVSFARQEHLAPATGESPEIRAEVDARVVGVATLTLWL